MVIIEIYCWVYEGKEEDSQDHKPYCSKIYPKREWYRVETFKEDYILGKSRDPEYDLKKSVLRN
jgi:hypothetical protein